MQTRITETYADAAEKFTKDKMQRGHIKIE